MALGKKIAIIGAGNMGEALVAGMLAAKAAAPDEIHATDIMCQRVDYLKARYQIRVGMDNKAAAAWSDISVLAVEPQVLDEVLDSLRAELTDAKLILSVAAGYPIRRVVAHLSPTVRVIRCMPNTPSEVQAGVSAIALGGNVSRGEDQTTALLCYSQIACRTVIEITNGKDNDRHHKRQTCHTLGREAGPRGGGLYRQSQ